MVSGGAKSNTTPETRAYLLMKANAHEALKLFAEW